MSKKTELLADLKRIGRELSGAHLTREARTATFGTFANAMQELGLGIRQASQIGGRHLESFAAARKAEGLSPRTTANELSHLRAVLNHLGKQGLTRNPNYSNRALGLERGSRVGIKEPLSDATITEFRLRSEQLGRAELGIVLELQRAMGLREAEAIRAGNSDTLRRWERELKDTGAVRVIVGTKGGRPRDTHPWNRDRALAAVRDALAILQDSGRRYLVARADGAPTTGLEQAMGIYRNLCHREGIQSHGARYAFAREQFHAYLQQGMSRHEALAATSLDLGHGDGRGRYVASVYLRDC